ncbi:MAG: hypothetical protein QOC99_2414 [Acidobacteriota bacterium]|nr:hypothetical protein [Acidobacteriota bacterium]
MTRWHERNRDRTKRLAALCLALFLLIQAAPLRVASAADRGDEEDAPPSKSEQSETLMQSLLNFFFAPPPKQQTPATTTSAAATTAQASATPSATPAPKADAQAQPSPAKAEAGRADEAKKDEAKKGEAKKGEAKPLQYPMPDWSPLGNAGPKTVESKDEASEEFIPMPDRWRFPWPRYDRYSPKHDTPWVTGSTFDPYNQNILKADYPIHGNHTFLNLNLQSASTLNPRVVAAGGRREQFFTNQNIVMGAEVFGGTGAFEPKRWAVRVTTVANFNFVANNTLNPFDSKRGNSRLAVEEAFIEKRLAVVSPNFDFVSVRVGMQNFNSDFRGFLFADNQLGARLFGTLNSQRDTYNIAFFSMRQREEVSQLHSWDRRHQNVFLVNWFRQDFGKKGYTALFNFVYNNDEGRVTTDRHTLNVGYLGFHGDGKWGKLNVDHAFYWAFGHDAFNRIAHRAQTVNAQMGAFEASVDRDWVRWRGSFFYASGDGNLNDDRATGFDMIQDNPNFAGGPFQFWTQQQTVVGSGIGTLKNKFSLLPNLRNKFNDRANFVNPGLLLWNIGGDFRVTPKLKMVTNLSYLRFARAGLLRQITGDNGLGSGIGTDLSVGAKFRPFENENMFFVTGAAILFPQGGYGRLIGSTRPLVSPTFAFQVAF